MEKANILVIEDDPSYWEFYRDVLTSASYSLDVAQDPKAGLEAIQKRVPDLVLLDLTFDGTPQAGLTAITEIVGRWPDLPITVVSGQDQSAIIMKALDLGAVDYIVKDHSLYDLLAFRVAQTLKKARLEERIQMDLESHGGLVFNVGQVIIGKSPKMRQVYDLIERVARNRSTVLVLGESGTGKELVAQAIHARKGQTHSPFVSIDCGSVPKTVLESELFGVKANYPGFHNKERLVGKLEIAGEGTLLLDEIANMDVDLQSSLLRVLEERRFTPIGDPASLPLRAQVIASTNCDLQEAVRAGRFREDLFYRLNEVPIVVPPLRERKEDIPLLVHHFLAQHESKTGVRMEILPESIDKLVVYDWPGNVRELLKAIQRALTICHSPYLTPKDFDLSPSTDQNRSREKDGNPSPSNTSITVYLPSSTIRLDQYTRMARKTYAEHVFRQSDGNRTLAAGLLGIDIRTLRRVLNDSVQKDSS